MQLNLRALTEEEFDHQRRVINKVVLVQYDAERPLNPHGLLIAYEEHHVLPVVSDFDALILGSKGLQSEPLHPQQLRLQQVQCDLLGEVLDAATSPPSSVSESSASPKGFTPAWQERLRQPGCEAAALLRETHAPRYGFGDPKSYEITARMAERLSHCGAVRHGAECFNYSYPQELDDAVMVVWEVPG